MHSPIRSAATVAALLLLAVACGPAATPGAATPGVSSPSAAGPSASGSAQVLPVVVSTELVVGQNRVLFSFLDASGATPVASPDRTARVSFSGPNGETVSAPDGQFIWAIEDVSGVYVTTADFPTAGAWTAQFTTAAPGGTEETVPFGFDVKEEANVVTPGEPAPSVDTPTVEDVGGDLRQISSDDEPVEAFYDTSVADALAASEPFVLVFATPAFCQSQTCGPTLEKIKAAAEDHPAVTFINVEPYQTEFVDGRLQPVLGESNVLQTVPAADAYGLVTEPYVFVVDGDGIVSASFELLFTPEEIDAALAELS